MTFVPPCISIVTPFYNTSNVFLETIASIYAQTFTDWEWIIVNDGSSDPDSILHLSELKNNGDGRIKIINKAENGGLPAARNTGINAAAAKYIFFIDSDDLIEAATLEKLYLFLLTNSEFHFANSYVKGMGGQNYEWKGGFHEGVLFLTENRNTSCFMACREVFENVLFDETMTQGCEDWEFWIHCASKKIWGYTIPEFLFYYRRTEEGKWSTLAGKESLKLVQKKIKNKYAPIISKNGFPAPAFESYKFGAIAKPLPVYNQIKKEANTLMCIFPWLKIGGADKFNLDLLKGLKAKGWEIIIITTLGADHPWEKYFEQITKDIFHIGNMGPAHKHYVFIDYLIKSRRPDTLFLSHSMYGYQILSYIKKRYPFLFIADYTHCEEPEWWYGGGYPFFSAIYSTFLDKSFVTSKHLQQWIINKGAIAEKTEVCYIGVDINSVIKNNNIRKKMRQQLGVSDNTSVILYVARLTEQKQPDVLVKSLQLLYEKYKDFRCIIIGEGPDEEKLKKLIKKYRLQKQVTLCSEQLNEVVLKYMDTADIFFLPSAYEGIALTLYESMAKELPIVGANVGGQAELVLPDCGYLIRRSTPELEALEYSILLEDLCKNTAKAKQMGLTGRARVEQYFSLQDVIDQFDKSIKKQPFPETEMSVEFTGNMSDIVMVNHLRHLEELKAENCKTNIGFLKRNKGLLRKYKIVNPITVKLYKVIKNI